MKSCQRIHQTLSNRVHSRIGTAGFPTAVYTLLYFNICICSTLLIIVVVFIDGFSKPDTPGSLRSPAATSWGTGSMTELGIAFGL